MMNYTKTKLKKAEALVFRGVQYTSTPRQQLLNQKGDNLCVS